MICSGCIHAPVYDNEGNEVDKYKCPFCRIPTPYTNEEANERTKKRVETGDANAIRNVGCDSRDGVNGFPQDHTKALELFHRAAVLGNPNAYCSIGYAYDTGEGLEVDKKKAKHYYELAAIKGDVYARHNLGLLEEMKGNTERALKHYMISVKSGQNILLQTIQQLYSNGQASKDDYTKALQSYQAYLDEIKSDARDKAAAAQEHYRYY